MATPASLFRPGVSLDRETAPARPLPQAEAPAAGPLPRLLLSPPGEAVEFETVISPSGVLSVLPRDPHRALVELAEFVPRRLVADATSTATPHQEALAGYLRDVLGVPAYEILRVESGVLPLRTRPVRRRYGRVLAIGARAGLIKASTGYAYQRIQRDSEAIAASLTRYGHPFRIPAPPRRYRLLDAALLEVLYRDPTQLERSFARLFKANGVPRVLRFLDEQSSVPADLRLMASMPPVPYLRALAMQFRGAGRIRQCG